MLKLFNNTKVLHLEPTDVCQAACPQCARETDLAFNKKTHHFLTVEQIVSLIGNDTIYNLDKMYMCGVYGDPAASMHSIDIFKYFRKINPNIVLGMNTNGAINNTEWWINLANILNKPKDYVIFSIDGLEDTNHIYRRNVKWNKLIENAQAFIQAGGLAHWDMLVFEHNEHQVNQCLKLAKDLGFYFFRAKVSRRYQDTPVAFLKQPKNWVDPVISSSDIKCAALKENELYISARGIIHPCCWLGGINGVNIDQFDHIQSSWNTDPYPVCQKICGTNITGNSYTNQWQKEVQLF
jgi:MoaA/NifB/PqqE/SkfB family radical SAM enzyme